LVIIFYFSAFIQSGDEKFDGIPLDFNGSGEFSSCLKPTGRTGRHSLECRATRSGVALLTSQSHSFIVKNIQNKIAIFKFIFRCQIDEWPSDRDYCPLEVQIAPAEVTTAAANVIQWTPEQEPSQAKEETDTESVDDTTQSAPSDGNKTLREEESGPMISSDSAQMIIVVVGGIIIAELVFIFVRCRRKAKDREVQRSIIPYTVEPKVNPNLKYEKVGKDDMEEDLS
jgi:hypothetical protein